jgi:transposase
VADDRINTIQTLRAAGYSYREIEEMCGVPRATAQRLSRQASRPLGSPGRDAAAVLDRQIGEIVTRLWPERDDPDVLEKIVPLVAARAQLMAAVS